MPRIVGVDIPKEKITITYLAAGKECVKLPIQKDNTILYIGDINPNKNISSLLKAVAILKNEKLVLVGKALAESKDIKNEIEISPTLNLIDNDGVMNSLIQKLDATEKKISQKLFKTAKNVLNAVANEIIAQKGKHISEEAADILFKDIGYIIQSISIKISVKSFSVMAGLSFINRFVTENLFNGLNKLIVLFRNLIERISFLFTNQQEKIIPSAPKITQETPKTQ